MSTVNDTDLLLVNRGGQSYNVKIEDMSTLQDTDLLLVNRGGQSYKIEAKDLPGGEVTAPVIVNAVLTEDNPGSANRFQDQSFTTTLTMNPDGFPTSDKYLKPKVAGGISYYGQTSPITDVSVWAQPLPNPFPASTSQTYPYPGGGNFLTTGQVAGAASSGSSQLIIGEVDQIPGGITFTSPWDMAAAGVKWFKGGAGGDPNPASMTFHTSDGQSHLMSWNTTSNHATWIAVPQVNEVVRITYTSDDQSFFALGFADENQNVVNTSNQNRVLTFETNNDLDNGMFQPGDVVQTTNSGDTIEVVNTYPDTNQMAVTADGEWTVGNVVTNSVERQPEEHLTTSEIIDIIVNGVDRTCGTFSVTPIPPGAAPFMQQAGCNITYISPDQPQEFGPSTPLLVSPNDELAVTIIAPIANCRLYFTVDGVQYPPEGVLIPNVGSYLNVCQYDPLSTVIPVAGNFTGITTSGSNDHLGLGTVWINGSQIYNNSTYSSNNTELVFANDSGLRNITNGMAVEQDAPLTPVTSQITNVGNPTVITIVTPSATSGLNDWVEGGTPSMFVDSDANTYYNSGGVRVDFGTAISGDFKFDSSGGLGPTNTLSFYDSSNQLLGSITKVTQGGNPSQISDTIFLSNVSYVIGSTNATGNGNDGCGWRAMYVNDTIIVAPSTTVPANVAPTLTFQDDTQLNNFQPGDVVLHYINTGIGGSYKGYSYTTNGAAPPPITSATFVADETFGVRPTTDAGTSFFLMYDCLVSVQNPVFVHFAGASVSWKSWGSANGTTWVSTGDATNTSQILATGDYRYWAIYRSDDGNAGKMAYTNYGFSNLYIPATAKVLSSTPATNQMVVDGGTWNNGEVVTGPIIDGTGTCIITNVSDKTMALENGYERFAIGSKVQTVDILPNPEAVLYLKTTPEGQIYDMQSADPGYTKMTSNSAIQTLTFPESFPSGDSVDTELPEGTFMYVDVKADNVVTDPSYKITNTVTPE